MSVFVLAAPPRRFGVPPGRDPSDAAALVRAFAECVARRKKTWYPYKLQYEDALMSRAEFARRYGVEGDAARSYLIATASGAKSQLVLSRDPARSPQESVAPGRPDVEARLLYADVCEPAAYVLCRRLEAGAFTLASKSRGRLTLSDFTIAEGKPEGYPNPLLFLLQERKPDGSQPCRITTLTATLHEWVRCVGTNPQTGVRHAVNLDPTIKQFDPAAPTIWFDDPENPPFRVTITRLLPKNADFDRGDCSAVPGWGDDGLVDALMRC